MFNDHLFVAATERISADDVFALSDEMKRYLDTEIAGQIRAKGSRQGLFDALYSKGQLKLEYDSVMTRNAAQAFAARSGNCLSLVIMTAAFAKEMGLPVRYQRASSTRPGVARRRPFLGRARQPRPWKGGRPTAGSGAPRAT